MAVLNFLEQLAACCHFEPVTQVLINQQKKEITNAFLVNDHSLLKRAISQQEYFANEHAVFLSDRI